MATSRKRKTKKVARKRVIRKSPEPLTKMDTHYATLHEMYKSALRAGFDRDTAFWMMTEKHTFPDWVVGDGGIIPTIDPIEDDEDFD